MNVLVEKVLDEIFLFEKITNFRQSQPVDKISLLFFQKFTKKNRKLYFSSWNFG